MARSPISVLTSIPNALEKAAHASKRNDILKRTQLRINSVSTPTDQITKLEQHNAHLISTVNDLYTYRDSLLKSNVILWYIIELQINGCLRISEVLDIKPSDIMANGQVIIHSKKGSQNKFVAVSDSARYLIQCRNNSVYPFQGITRQYIGRQYIKLGISIPNILGIKNATTHAIRHLVVSQMSADGMSIEDQATITGHKKTDNLKYYDHTKKKRTNN